MHGVPLKNVFGQCFKVKIKTFGSSLLVPQIKSSVFNLPNCIRDLPYSNWMDAYLFSSLHAGYFSPFLLSADFFKITFSKNSTRVTNSLDPLFAEGISRRLCNFPWMDSKILPNGYNSDNEFLVGCLLR